MSDYELFEQPIITDQQGDLVISELRNIVIKANQHYYLVGSKPIMTDEQYEKYKNRLRTLSPNDELLTTVGSKPAEFRSKVTHSIPMGSLDNTDNGIDGFLPWYESVCNTLKNECAISATLKVDGNSVCASYKKGKLVQVASRGNGEIGEDITQNGKKFIGMLHTLPQEIDLEVRGEAILYKADFEKICERDGRNDEDRSNARNVGSGIIGRENGKDSELIRFMPFNVVGPNFTSESAKFQFLKTLGFNPIPIKLCLNVDSVTKFYNSMLEGRDSLPFEVDGLVVVLNEIEHQNQFITSDIKTKLRPKYARAIKMPYKNAVTKLLDVLLTVGHSRAIIPTALLQSVNIGGVNVTHALLNNWDEIKRLGIAINDDVIVVRSGDVIPKAIGVAHQSEDRIPIVEPIHCPKCGSATTREYRGKKGAITYCSNLRCSAAVYAKLDHWIGNSKKGVGILGIGDGILQTLWDNELVSDPSDLYLLTVEKIKDLKIDDKIKIGDSRARLIVDNIQNKKILSLPVFLGSLGIDLLGRRRTKLMIDSAKGQLSCIESWLQEGILENIELPGFGDTIRESIVAGIRENEQLIYKLIENGVVIENDVSRKAFVEQLQNEPEINSTQKSSSIAGKSFCWTGTRELIEEVEAAGGIIKSGISKGLNYLVQKDPTSQSTKTVKAESLGTKIIGIEFLKQILTGEAELPIDK